MTLSVLVADPSEAADVRGALTEYGRRRGRPLQLVEARDSRMLAEAIARESFDMIMVDTSLGNLDPVAALRAEDPSGVLVGLCRAPGARDVEVLRALRGYDIVSGPIRADDLGRLMEVQSVLGKPIRVLVVDDSAATRKVILKVLSRSAFPNESREASNGQFALAQFNKSRFDIVVLDLNMPGLDGTATLRRIRGISPDTKVIIVSSEDETTIERRSAAVGRDGYLKKPFFPDALDACIRRLRGVPEPFYL
ncbi:response regulator [Prosthecomicrobium sp. N25]|uniref:response regulator n=1 Tax=Prosthecomicrobium sp. N25 TaxID=3129254 RepID=UPI003077C980